MTEEERKKQWQEALRKASLGPQGPMGPNGPLFTGTGTISTPKPKSNFQKIKDAAYGVLPQGAYGTSQTIGPLATQINPVPSLKRTFTGENAGKYLNFNNGLNWKQRLGLGLEDAINIGSIAIPGLRAAKVGPNALVERKLAESIARYKAPELFDYGVHVSVKPNLSEINSSKFLNQGFAAGDALPNNTYYWRISPFPGEKIAPTQNNVAAFNSQLWSNRIGQWGMYDNPENSTITSYLTKVKHGKSFPDEHLAEGAWNANPAARSEYPLEVIDSANALSEYPNIEPGSLEAFNIASGGDKTNPLAMEQDVKKMIERYAKELARNNRMIESSTGAISRNMSPRRYAQRFK